MSLARMGILDSRKFLQQSDFQPRCRRDQNLQGNVAFLPGWDQSVGLKALLPAKANHKQQAPPTKTKNKNGKRGGVTVPDIPSKPDGRQRAVAQLSNDPVSSLMQDVSEMDRVEASWSIAFDPFSVRADIVKSRFGSIPRQLGGGCCRSRIHLCRLGIFGHLWILCHPRILCHLCGSWK